MGCAGNDLESGVPFLFNRYPDMLAHGGGPRVERLVRDQDFDTFDEALRATQLQDRPADPDQWRLGGLGKQPLYPQRSLTGPDQPRNLRTAERLAVGLISVSVFALSLYAGFRFGVWLGQDDPGGWGTGDAALAAFYLLFGAGWLAGSAGTGTAWLLRRRDPARDQPSPTEVAREPWQY
jgi:hypothetical protein